MDFVWAKPSTFKEIFLGGLSDFETLPFGKLFFFCRDVWVDVKHLLSRGFGFLEAEGLQKARISYVIAYWRTEIFILS